MASMLDIVRQAYRKIGVLAKDEEIDADDTEAGIDALNNMMSAWALAGVDIGHHDLGVGDVFPLPDPFREGTVYMLASRLAADYQAPAQFDPDEWFRKFQAYYEEPPVAVLPRALTYNRIRRYF